MEIHAQLATPASDGRNPALDGLRAVAVVLVIGVHYGVPVAHWGGIGVDLFFVLSGYLITSILAREWRRTSGIDLRRFYFRRALRLFPALWTMLVFALFFVPVAHVASILLYVNNYALGFRLLPVEGGLGHAWSLAIEEQFYLLWPVALILLLRRLRPRTVVVLATTLGLGSALWRAVLLTDGANLLRAYDGTDSHADGLLLGSALGLALAYGLLPTAQQRWSALVGAAGVAVLAAIALLPPMPVATFDSFGEFVAVVAGLAVIWSIATAPSSLIPSVLAVAPLAFIGRISYGLYLWHVPVLDYVTRGGPIVSLALTVAVVLLSYRYLELPIQRYKARMSSRTQGRIEPFGLVLARDAPEPGERAPGMTS